ncbi:MAG: hypothetical protein AN484_27085, partial [Aphanizomenon flos-aquae WA102]
TGISRLGEGAGTGRTFEELQRIVAYVVLIADRFKGQTDLNVLPGQVTRKTKKDGSVLVKYRPAHPCSLSMATAEAILIEDAQRSMNVKATASLMPREIETTYVIGQPRKLVVVGQRPQEYLQSVFRKPALPILCYDSPLARRVMTSAHEVDHSGVTSTVLRSRKKAWIIKGRSLARGIRNHCFQCRIEAKRCSGQVMAPTPAHRLGPAPPFFSTAIDLFGPLEVRGTVDKRKTGKAWGVIFVDTATSAVHVELAESYSCDSFMAAMRNFMNTHGAP